MIMNDKVGKAKNKWEWMHSGLSQCSIYSTDLLSGSRDGGGCLYTVIQWKTAASVLQGQA